MADVHRKATPEPMEGFYLGNGVTVFRLPGKHGYIVVRPGDMMYNTPEQAEDAARRGADLDQKVGCHLAWLHPTVPEQIKDWLRERWGVTGHEDTEPEPQDDTDQQFYTLRQKIEQDKLFKRIKITGESELMTLVFYLAADLKNVQRMTEALDVLDKLN